MGKKAVWLSNSVVNIMILLLVLLLVVFGCYALWDNAQIHNAADAAQYAIYKPSVEDEGLSFAQLQAINPEVFAWLTVYGTSIDYPVTQGEGNMKYVNTNVMDEYSLVGSIFMDYRNSQDFSDFNSIMFGHHMDKQRMFGEIGLFAEEAYFDVRQYGNLYYQGQNHGIEFFAFLHTDAYDSTVYSVAVEGAERQQQYLDNLLSLATHTRENTVSIADNILLLSTCSSSSTNGRDILVGRITDETYEDVFSNGDTNYGGYTTVDEQGTGFWSNVPWWLKIAFIAIILIILLFLLWNKRKEKQNEKKEQ